MPSQTACPHCDQTYTLAENLEGKKVRCKSCQKTFTVIFTAPPGDVGSGEKASRRVRKAPSGARRSPAEPPDDADDFAFEDEPGQVVRPRGQKRGGIPLWVWLLGGGGIFLFLCCGGGTVGFFLMGGTDLFGNKVTMENFNKIQNGMTEDEVIAILGEPDETAGTPGQLPSIPGLPQMPRMPADMQMKMMIWTKGENTIMITFRNNEVAGKNGHFRN